MPTQEILFSLLLCCVKRVVKLGGSLSWFSLNAVFTSPF